MSTTPRRMYLHQFRLSTERKSLLTATGTPYTPPSNTYEMKVWVVGTAMSCLETSSWEVTPVPHSSTERNWPRNRAINSRVFLRGEGGFTEEPL